MPVEAEVKSPPADTPTKKKSSNARAASAKVSLLDGSVLDVTIDVGFAITFQRIQLNLNFFYCSAKRKVAIYWTQSVPDWTFSRETTSVWPTRHRKIPVHGSIWIVLYQNTLNPIHGPLTSRSNSILQNQLNYMRTSLDITCAYR